MKYFVLMALALGLSGCPGIDFDIGIGQCDGARITQAQRFQCSGQERVVCKACSGGECTRTQCLTLAQERQYLESLDGDLSDAWPSGLRDGGLDDGGLDDRGIGDQ